MGIKMTLTTPVVNEYWWEASRNELTKVVERYNKQSWKAQSDPVTYQKWKPRKPPTGTWPLLRKTGLMEKSAKFYTEQGKKGLFFAETVYYGPYMQYGTSTVPARRWLGIGQKMLDPMAKVIKKHVFRKGTVTLKAG
jgi:hypothetical protein